MVGRYLKNLLVKFVQTKIFLPFIISLSKRCLGFLIQCFFHGIVDLQKSRVSIFFEKIEIWAPICLSKKIESMYQNSETPFLSKPTSAYLPKILKQSVERIFFYGPTFKKTTFLPKTLSHVTTLMTRCSEGHQNTSSDSLSQNYQFGVPKLTCFPNI